MSILRYFKNNKTSQPQEVASNKNIKQQTVSKESHPDFYQSQLESLMASYFMNQAVCSASVVGGNVSINLAQNALNAWGTMEHNTNPNALGVFSFVDYCNAVYSNPNLNTSNYVVHNQNIFANNLLNNPNFNQQELAGDISILSQVYEAVLASYAGTTKNPTEVVNLTSIQLYSLCSIYDKSPQYTFRDEYFAYPDGSYTENAKITTDTIYASDPQGVTNALKTIANAASIFQQNVLDHQEDLNPAVQ
ncbi:MAG: hypothetical protein IJD48_01030 [Clostridia bacterium]|nr:hypothetical protein [Clostridia bacterium]